MVKIRQAIVVEGKYDKNTLRQLVDTAVFTTEGFGILSDKAMLSVLRRVAEERGLIILTDSDGAGFVIRNYLKGALPKDKVLHAYIPDVYGKERRKAAPGKEGKLGVEGMPPEVLLDVLRRAGADLDAPQTQQTERLTKADLVELGLSGGKESRSRRLALQKYLRLPEHLSANGLLEVLNILYDKPKFFACYRRWLAGETAEETL